MPKNEDGEFELVLGNGQLLAMFFVVAILFGVFFVLGYVVGRNSAPLVNAEPAIARKPDTKPPAADIPAPKQSSAPEADAPSPDSPKPVETAVQQPVEPRPEPPKSEPTKPSTSKSEPAVKREVAKVEKAHPTPPSSQAPPSNPAQSNQPVAGQSYLQLVATNKHDADMEVAELRKNGFPALDVEIPEKLGTFRVYVGPVAAGEANKMKSELQGKGFQGNAAIPKKF